MNQSAPATLGRQSTYAPNGGEPRFDFFVVALIDVLGQRERLNSWDVLEASPNANNGLVEAILDSFGQVHQLRFDFPSKLHRADRAMTDPERGAKFYPDGEASWPRYSNQFPSFMQFSDTIVAFSPLKDQFGYRDFPGVYRYLFAAGELLLSALSRRIAIRGAIEIGVAGQFEKTDLYGPVLVCAHNLESKVAEFPRIVAGPKLVEFLHQSKSFCDYGCDGTTEMNQTMADRCMGMLYQDKNDCWSVDYLGNGFALVQDNPAQWADAKNRACRFVKEERARFEREGNRKLAPRYAQLEEYFQSRGVTGGT